MKHFGIGAFAAAVVVASAGSAAATVFDGFTIDDVDINGVFYDVTFADGLFDTVYPTLDLTFTDYVGARDAADAIVARSEFQALATPSFPGLLVAYGVGATFFRTALAGGSVTPGDYIGDRSLNYSNYGYTFATFEVAAVPEPATWALMILGFGAVGAGARQRAARTA